MLRRRSAIAVVVIAVVALLGCVGAAALRYARFCGSRRKVAEARVALGRVADESVRRDLSAHAAYLESRLERGWLYAKRDVFLGRLHGAASQLREAALGEVPLPHRAPGHHVIVTVSRVDGAEMPTSVRVPDGWDGAEPLPLILHLHPGGVAAMGDCFPVPGHPGALCVAPLARGSHDYLGAQMTSVEECLADVRGRFPVGDVYVLGTSMGGLGAWLFAQRHAGRVAGISPWAGNADPDAWQGVWEAPREEPRSAAGRAWRRVRAARSPVARVGQLLPRPDLPIYVGHGTKDTIIPFGHSASMVEKLRRLGATQVRFDRFAGRGHKDIPRRTRERIAWLLERGQAGGPETIAAIIPPLTFVADCPGAPPHRVADPLEEARLTIRSGTWCDGTNVEPADGSGPSKWHYPGPAGAAFDHPLSIDLPPEAPEHLRQCADDLAAAWEGRYGGKVRRSHRNSGFANLPERHDERERRTLVALGSPEENPAVRAALAGLDVRVGPREARLFGRAFEGDDVGLIMLRPDLSDLRAGTLVVWGSTPDSYRQLWRRFGQDVHWEGARGRWWFDYAVFDRKTCGPETFLAVGYFDHAWRFEPSLLFEGSRELRARIPGSHWAMKSHGERLWLSSLAPEQIVSWRGPVGFDRSAGVGSGPLTLHGESCAHGLGMVPPATVRWRLSRPLARLTANVGLERTGKRWPVRDAAERVRFEIWGDGRRLAASPTLSSADPTAELSADLRGVEVLELRALNTTTHIWHYGPVAWGHAELFPE